MGPHDQWKTAWLMLRKMSTMGFMHKLIFVIAHLDREKQLWQREPSENSSLPVLSGENTHTQSQERTSFPEGMTPVLVPEWQGQQRWMKTRMILLMFMWLHQAPQGLRVVSVECDVHCTVRISLKHATALKPFPVCRGLWFALWPQESSLAVARVLYRVKKVLHPNNVN